MKKMLATTLAAALAVSLLALPAAAAEGTARRDYFTDNGCTVLQETPAALPLTYTNYDPEAPDRYIASDQGGFSVHDCTVSDSAVAGYQDIDLTVAAYMYQRSETYVSCVWNFSFYDYYTGRAFPLRGSDGDTGDHYTAQLDCNGRSYPVIYSVENSWEPIADADRTYGLCCISQVRFTVPKGYNGLVYCLPATTLPPVGAGGQSEGFYQPRAGDQLFRFGHTLTADTPTQGLELRLDFKAVEDTGLLYSLSLTNNSGAAAQGSYALACYDVRSDGSAHGLFYPIDVELAPDGMLTADLRTGRSLARMHCAWIRFDSQSQRDAFLSAGWLREDKEAGLYEAESGKAFAGWLAKNGLS